ncbi:lipopolysaccharide heptosyltransferase II [Halonatronum saccharophilum]|uniref:lipopolysaccharide heptosyltransferase II n=1 Tax=Halonatronum saccharophilum TaxID=150060 RepID=UPI0004B55619|nr:lipopolysaccharide heptosyltransferase II [Halonatronum saccharophilum]
MKRLYYIIYDILLIVLLIIYSPVIFYKTLITREYKEGFWERFGFLPNEIKEITRGNKVVWVHAASVGEVGAASPLIKELRNKAPDAKILLSTMTATGRRMGRTVVKEIDGLIYVPCDLSFAVKRTMRLVKPELLLIIETELWPNLIRVAKGNEAQIMIASGRIGDKSYNKYKYLGPLLKDTLSKVDLFSMQSKKDKKRIISLGAKADKVCNNGNTKFDQDYGTLDNKEKAGIYKEFGLNPKDPILVIGSTHENEEEMLIPLYKGLKDKHSKLVTIIAPRYPDRAKEVEKIYNEEGIKTIRRTKIDERNGESLIILDTIGELAKFYGIGDLIFVGGSLIPRGGHNILEPASQGKLVFFGPHTFNFKDSRKLLLDKEVGVEVKGINELLNKMGYYLSYPKKLKEKEKLALKVIEENKGASWRNGELASHLVKRGGTLEILLIRLSAIGDVIHSLPIAKEIRENYPEAKITWIVEDKAQAVVANNPYLDRIIVMPKAKWKREFKDDKLGTLKEIRAFFKELRSNKFDIALDVHGLFKSGITCFFSGAKRRIGPADGREGSKIFYNEMVNLPKGKIHQIDRSFYLAKSLGGVSGQVDFGITLNPQEELKVQKVLRDLNLNENKPLIVINPFTSWSSKNWLKIRYAKLADKLIEEYGCEVIFTGSPADRGGVEKIRALMRRWAVNLAGQTTLKELAGIYKESDFFIGGDTGPMHLAVAVDTPVIALFGPTDPKTHGPYGHKHTVIQKEMDCLGCWKRKCKKGKTCMSAISVEDVLVCVNKLITDSYKSLKEKDQRLRR